MLRQENGLSNDIHFRSSVSNNLMSTNISVSCALQNMNGQQSSIDLKLVESSNSTDIIAEQVSQLQQQLLHRTQQRNERRPNSALSSAESSASADSGCSFGGSSPVNFPCTANKDTSLMTRSSNQVKVATSSMLETLTTPLIPVNEKKLKNEMNEKDQQLIKFMPKHFSNVTHFNSSPSLLSSTKLLHAISVVNNNNNNDYDITEPLKEKPLNNGYNIKQQNLLSNVDNKQHSERQHEVRFPFLPAPQPQLNQRQFDNGLSSVVLSSNTNTTTTTTVALLPPPPATSTIVNATTNATPTEVPQVFSDITQYINPEIHNVRYTGVSYLSPTANTTMKMNKQETYKTVMCQAWLESTKCFFGENCKFAHGETELRPARIMSRNSAKYKTKLCEKYTTSGICPYGNRCLFIHPSPKSINLLDSARHNSPFVNPELYPQTTVPSSISLQQLNVNVHDDNVTNLNHERQQYQSPSKDRHIPHLTSSQSLLNFHQRFPSNFPLQPQQQASFSKDLQKHKEWNQEIVDSCRRQNKNDTKEEKMSTAWTYETSKSLSKGVSNNSLQLNATEKQEEKISTKLFFAKDEDNLEISRDTSDGQKIDVKGVKEFLPLTSFNNFLAHQMQVAYSSSSTSLILPKTASTMAVADNQIVYGATKTSLLRRLNSTNTINTQKLNRVSTRLSTGSNYDTISQIQHFGSAALGREESEIWSSDSTRFVMGTSLSSLTSSSPIMEDSFSTALDNEDFPVTENQCYQESKSPNSSKLASFFESNDSSAFEHLCNTLNDLIIRRNEEWNESNNDSFIKPVEKLKKRNATTGNSTTESNNVNIKISDLVREMELQKLEEYLIASEQILSFERSQNDFERNDLKIMNHFEHPPSLSTFQDILSNKSTSSLISQQCLTTGGNNTEALNLIEFNNLLSPN